MYLIHYKNLCEIVYCVNFVRHIFDSTNSLKDNIFMSTISLLMVDIDQIDQSHKYKHVRSYNKRLTINIFSLIHFVTIHYIL